MHEDFKIFVRGAIKRLILVNMYNRLYSGLRLNKQKIILQSMQQPVSGMLLLLYNKLALCKTYEKDLPGNQLYLLREGTSQTCSLCAEDQIK